MRQACHRRGLRQDVRPPLVKQPPPTPSGTFQSLSAWAQQEQDPWVAPETKQLPPPRSLFNVEQSLPPREEEPDDTLPEANRPDESEAEHVDDERFPVSRRKQVHLVISARNSWDSELFQTIIILKAGFALHIRVYDKASNLIDMEQDEDGLTGLIDLLYLIKAVNGDQHMTREDAHKAFGSTDLDRLPLEILCHHPDADVNYPAVSMGIMEYRVRWSGHESSQEGFLDEFVSMSSRSQEAMIVASARAALVIPQDVVPPNVVASIRGQPPPPVGSIGNDALEITEPRITVHDVVNIQEPDLYMHGRGDPSNPIGLRFGSGPAGAEIAHYLFNAQVVTQRILRFPVPRVDRTTLGILRITPNLAAVMKQYYPILQDLGTFEMSNSSGAGGDNCITFYTRDKPRTMVGIKPVNCPSFGVPDAYVPRIPDEFLQKCGPSYGFITIPRAQLLSMVGPTRGPLHSRTTYNALNNEIPLVFRESLRLGRVHLSTPSDFEVRLCHVADLCPGRDGIPGDEMIAIMIQVAGANYPLTFYELWKTQSRHQIIGTPGALVNDGTVTGAHAYGGCIPATNIVGYYDLEYQPPRELWARNAARLWLQGPHVPKPGNLYPTPKFPVWLGGDVDHALLSAIQPTFTKGVESRVVPEVTWYIQFTPPPWLRRETQGNNQEAARSDQSQTIDTISVLQVTAEMRPFLSTHSSRNDKSGTDTALLAAGAHVALVRGLGPVGQP